MTDRVDERSCEFNLQSATNQPASQPARQPTNQLAPSFCARAVPSTLTLEDERSASGSISSPPARCWDPASDSHLSLLCRGAVLCCAGCAVVCCVVLRSLIEYPAKEDVDNALRKLDDTKLDGAVVRLYEVKKDSAGGGSGGGGRGRSRSRSPPPRRDRSQSPRRSRSRSPRKDDRGSRGADRDDRRDRSRSRSPRRDRSRSPVRESSSGGNGGSSALAGASNGSSAAEAAESKSPARD